MWLHHNNETLQYIKICEIEHFLLCETAEIVLLFKTKY